MAGESGLTALVFVGVAAAVLFSFRTGLLLAGLTVLVAGVTPWLVPRWSLDESYALAVLLGSLAGFAFVNLIRRNQELVTAREEVAQLATAEERLRVARDIHDVLGQHLTAITVKSELAGKLIQRNLQSAEHELADIQRLSREALADLRSVVSGYREVSLAVELARARGVLEAAGVLVQLPDDMPSVVDAVPAERRELFGWVIREGVTNVVRHSAAHTCRVSVSPNAVEVSDDGRGLNGASRPTGWSGAGLTGLSERAARTGGQLAVTGGDGGGFVLHVELPEARSA
jgi:two-component system, NarL family, sensor histidine kinase DesK